MKLLNGKELAEYIKERQLKQVRALKQAYGINPKLAIIVLKDDPVINVYVSLKKRYGADIGVEVDVHTIDQTRAAKTIAQLNGDDYIHGIIVQLQLPTHRRLKSF
jgi:methylenetetrahydrofolate dehydrogenase (NADP+)/methenyltetrahydrofolate cyclohydrolase